MTKFKTQLKSINIQPEQYLKIAKNSAGKTGLDPAKLEFSDKTTKKLVYNGVHFGAVGYKDFIIYSLLNDPKRDIYRKRYHDSHTKIAGEWKQQKERSANWLSLNVNW